MHNDDDMMTAMIAQKMKDPEKSVTGLSSLFGRAKAKIDNFLLMRRVDRTLAKGRAREAAARKPRQQ